MTTEQMNAKDLEAMENEIESQEDDAVENSDLESIDTSELKAEDIKDEDLTEEAIEEFVKSKGAKLKIKKKEPVAKAEAKKVEDKKLEDIKEPYQQPSTKENADKKQIPYNAYFEQKQKRIEAEKKYAEAMQKLKAYEEKEKVAPVTYEDDPLEYVKTRQDKQDAIVQADIASKEASYYEQQFIQTYATAAQDFSKSQNDFSDAYNHLWNQRTQQLALFGYAPEMIKQIVEAEERGLVANALERGFNPAAKLYELARMSGYSPKINNSVTPQNPQPTRKLENIQKGQQLNTPIKGGRVAGQDLTDEVIDDIDSINPLADLNKKTALDLFFEKMASR
jgi:hypothetical protein